MPGARPHRAGRRSVAALLFCCAAFLPASALAGAPSPGDTASPSFEKRLSAFAASLFDAAERQILAPARRDAVAAFADPRAERIYHGVRDALRRFGESAKSRVLRPAAERLSKFFGNARRVIEEWIGRELKGPFGKSGELKTASAAVIPEAALRGDLPQNLTADDPFEPVNRVIFGMNGELRLVLFDPVSGLYLAHTTPGVQASVHRFFANLHEPVTVVASALEGRFADAGTAAARFGINTTLGVGGLFDPAAARFGLTVRARNLEQALCRSGLPAGPYLVLPILGPATLRDAAGRLATVVAYFEVMGVYVYVPYRLSDLALQYADRRGRKPPIGLPAGDSYAAQRALYLTASRLGCGEVDALGREFFAR